MDSSAFEVDDLNLDEDQVHNEDLNEGTVDPGDDLNLDEDQVDIEDLNEGIDDPELGSYRHDDMHSSYIVDLPDGTKGYIPIVAESLKPVLHARFDTLVQAIMIKSGTPNDKSFNTHDRSRGKREFRNSNVKRCGCKASIRFRLLKEIGKYECYGFVEYHNHPLLSSDDMCFSRKRRQVGFGDQMLIIRGNSSNIGASRVHKMKIGLKGGYEFSSSSSVDFQNFKRDVDKYVVKGGDAQMFIEMMNRRKEDAPNFFFDYKVSNSKLICILWADEASRFHYNEFGDVMSFDATFRTNRYCMVFIPFTVVDNHKKTVVVGAALVNKETVPNFKWVLEAFLRAHKKQPTLVLTDQCPSMKQAIAAVFPNSRHRLCMWHIMNKLPLKFSSQFLKETNFRKEFNKIVWDVLLEPNEFELKWNTLMEDYCFTGEKWLKSLFKIRESWIPAYFRDIPMCSLMKTTSHSESINSFFNSFSHYGNTLVFFMKSFDAALDKQRFTQRNLDHVTSLNKA
ncbi:hypothetical protein OSB04_017600 [Centaurea solstitialis]|uniref:Protein FAR1-RELATED SEQUENCE n=1 Tax=Centaurea solstitialis TaxID=347529 RepID=A0AA38TF27_9ASTR|nr:hypothetical protein OSB04_017600 [Centaurea solstitialis]